MTTAGSPQDRPRARGISHGLAFLASLVSGPLLVAQGMRFGEPGLAALYAVATSLLFLTSALLHAVTWPRAQYLRMQRIDRAVICCFIAVTYTVVFGLAPPSRLGTALVALCWTGAAVGSLLKIVWPAAPKWASAAAYASLGWLALPALPGLIGGLGLAPVAWLLGGGVLFTLGALVYGLKRPDPVPAVFGFHELFHLLVIGGVAAHHVAIAAHLLPRAQG